MKKFNIPYEITLKNYQTFASSTLKRLLDFNKFPKASKAAAKQTKLIIEAFDKFLYELILIK
jgi:hypothetical protein